MLSRCLFPEKAPAPRVFSSSGSTISVNTVSLNAFLPMLFNPSGRLKSVILADSNALSPIVVRSFGNSIFVRLVHQ